MAKISSMIFGIILVGLFVFIIGSAMSNFSQKYGLSYDNTTLSKYDKLEEYKNTSEEMKEKAFGSNQTKIEQFTDIVGGWFTSGYNVIILTSSSAGTIEDMSSKAIDSVDLGQTGGKLKIVIGSIIFLIFTFAIIRLITKEDA